LHPPSSSSRSGQPRRRPRPRDAIGWRPAPADQGWTPRGRAERILGAEECRKGQVDNGVRLLEQAIRMAGYKVPAA